MLQKEKCVSDQVQFSRRDHASLDLQRFGVGHAAEIEKLHKQIRILEAR
jgi:hypothetical protein